MPALLDLKGEKYNRLTVIGRAPKGDCGKTKWRCRCDCGNIVELFTMHIRSGHTKSCGCIPRQNSDRVLDKKTGKMVRPDGFWSWKSIQSRCYTKSDPNYKRYGARGITVCDRWLGKGGLKNFLDDMGPRPSKSHSVGSKDFRIGYTPANCKWETPIEQGANKRNSRMFTHNGKTQHLTAWERDLGLCLGSLRLRLNRGWKLHEALSTPRLGRAPVASGMKPETTGCVNQEAARQNDGLREWLAD